MNIEEHIPPREGEDLFSSAQLIEPFERYTREVQLPYCCVPAAMLMILQRRGLDLISQEKIGWELGLVVPESIAYRFSSVRSGEPGSAGYGTRINLPEFSLPAFLAKNSIPLEFAYVPPHEICNAEILLTHHLRRGDDIIACFDVGELYNRPDLSGNGHVSLVDSIQDGIVRFVESVGSRDPLQLVKIDDVTRAMHVHGQEKMGGFWILSDSSLVTTSSPR